GPARQAVRGVPGHARAAQERGRADHRLGRGRRGPRRPARAGPGRRRRLERRGGRGGGHGAAAPAPDPPRIPALLRPARLPGRGDGGGLPEPGRGVRAAGARGDGLRGAGADDSLHLAARGGRRGGRLHRTRRRLHPGRAARAARRRCPAGMARERRVRPVPGVHLGRVGRSPPGQLPARRRTDRRRCQRGVTSHLMPREPLEAIVLVGGQGTRLRPLTLSTPKPLLPTAAVPFLAHVLARAASGGVTHVVLATCYKADMFASSLGDGSAFGLSIDYVTEEVPLDTGGGIRNAARSLRGSGAADPVVVLNCDILSGHDLGVQVDLHIKTDAAVTLHLVEVADPAPFGCVPTDASGRVTAFLEKTPDPVTNRINAGCYVFRREVIDQIPAGRRVSVERETFPGLIDAGQLVMGYHESAYWLDVGTPQAFVRGSCGLVLGRPAGRCLAPPGLRCCWPGRRWPRRPPCPAAPWWAQAPAWAPGRPWTAACC